LDHPVLIILFHSNQIQKTNFVGLFKLDELDASSSRHSYHGLIY
jgi:hypothetical protein